MNIVMADIIGDVIKMMLFGCVGLTLNNEKIYIILITGKLKIAAIKDNLNEL